MNSKRKNNIVIAINMSLVIFSLASGFAGTYAWFDAQRTFEADVEGFSIATPPDTEFELYYLDGFVDSDGVKRHDGNQNSATGVFSGYEIDYSKATFVEVEYDGDRVVNNPDPTDITHLWPAHNLTYALVLTQGSFASFTLDQWSEKEDGAALVDADSPVLLSWAINIYGGVYCVDEPEGELTEEEKTAAILSDAYRSYYGAAKTDGFNYSEAEPALKDGEGLCTTQSVIIPSGSSVGEGSRTVAFFTIQFSNASATFYTRSLASPFYYSLDENGDSNCYEGLSLNTLRFSIN